MQDATTDREVVAAIGEQVGHEILQGLRPWPSWLPRPAPSQRELRLAARERGLAKLAKTAARCEAFLRRRFGITRRRLCNLIWSMPVTRVAARFGMSDNGLRKTCRRYGIPTPARGYWRNVGARKRTKTFERPGLPPLK
jgi:hypothetical protein